MSIEAMKLALEALEINLVFLRNVKPFKGQEDLASDCVAMTEETITSLRQAIEQAEKQEPVAYINVEQRKLEWAKYTSWDTPTVVNLPKIPLYTTPQPQREWVGLTDEEREQATGWSVEHIEQALKEKNT